MSHSLARFIKLKEEAKLNDANEKKKKFVKAKVDNEDRPGIDQFHFTLYLS